VDPRIPESGLEHLPERCGRFANSESALKIDRAGIVLHELRDLASSRPCRLQAILPQNVELVDDFRIDRAPAAPWIWVTSTGLP